FVNTIAESTDARAYIAPTERSIPPAMITNVAPTAMMAMKLVSLASWARLRALRNLFFSTITRSVSPLAVLWNSTMRTLPPNAVSTAPSRRTTRTSPISWMPTSERIRAKDLPLGAGIFDQSADTLDELPAVRILDAAEFLDHVAGPFRLDGRPAAARRNVFHVFGCHGTGLFVAHGKTQQLQHRRTRLSLAIANLVHERGSYAELPGRF